MSTSPLFRAQALKYATVRQYGSIVLLRPPILSWLTALLCLVALAILLFFSLASYTRKEQVSGVLMPNGGLIRVQATQAGVMRQVRVTEGQEVRAGDVLFVLANGAAGIDRIGDEAQSVIAVRAPQAGMVSGIIAQPGQAFAMGQVLANLSPAGSLLEAELYVPSQAAGFAKVGMPVQIRYRAYPFQKFGQFQGRISEISRSPLGGEEWPGGAGRSTEPLYRIRVALPQQSVSIDGQNQALMAGMVLDASLLLETRKLYEWVLEPLSGINGKV
jgi:multidrug efflux pump subunit AcrA (membrane-fusion protein)